MQYKFGRATILSVTQQQQSLTGAQQNLIDSQIAYLNAVTNFQAFDTNNTRLLGHRYSILELYEKYMLKQITIYFIILSLLLITACSKHSKNSAADTLTVMSENQQTPLYFTGSVKPIHVVTIVSPVDGTVATRKFQYGSEVKSGQLLLTLSSNALTKDYQTTLTSFLTAKQKYADSQNTMAGTKYLYHAGLIAKNDYLNGVSNLSDTNLSYIQTRVQLEKILSLIKVPTKEIKLLSIGETQAIEKALNKTISAIPIQAATYGLYDHLLSKVVTIAIVMHCM